MKFLLSTILILLFAGASAQQIHFERNYAGSTSPVFYTYGTSLLQLPDSGFLVTGEDQATMPPNSTFVLRTDKYGDSLWFKSFPMIIGWKILKTYDGNFILCGFDDGSPLGGIVLTKIDINGDTLWEKRYGPQYGRALICAQHMTVVLLFVQEVRANMTSLKLMQQDKCYYLKQQVI